MCIYNKKAHVCVYICVEVVLINVLASHLAPPNKNSWLRPCLYWPYSSNGLYNCKSGNKFLKMEEELMDRAHDSAIDEDTQIWKRIWSMNVPQKVKTLLWRACREAMPTKCSLFRRKIAEEDLWVRCSAATENSLHALWSCSELDLV